MVLAASGFPVLTLSHSLPRRHQGHRFSVLEQISHVILQGRQLELGNTHDMGPIVSQWHPSLRPGHLGSGFRVRSGPVHTALTGLVSLVIWADDHSLDSHLWS